MDIASLIAAFATDTCVITRRASSGQVVRGVVQELETNTFTLTDVSISPAAGRDLERLPEGRMDRETRVLFTATRLYVGGQDQQYQADLVRLDNVDWEVQHVETWAYRDGVQKGYKCLIQRP